MRLSIALRSARLSTRFRPVTSNLLLETKRFYTMSDTHLPKKLKVNESRKVCLLGFKALRFCL
jgi:hypothetical protein